MNHQPAHQSRGARLPTPLWIILLLSTFSAIGQVPPSVMQFPEGVHSVELPFTRYRDWIIVKASVQDSEELTFILDTGAPIVVLADPEAGDNLQLPIAGQAMVDGGEGEPPKAAPLAAGINIGLGPLQIGNCLVAIGAATEAIYGVDGILGKYVFENAVVHIDWEKEVLTLTKPGHFRYEGSGTKIPFQLAPNGHIFTEITLQSSDRNTSIPAILDTGNRSNLKMDQPGYEEFFTNGAPLHNVVTGWGANGPEYGNLGRMDVEFGGFPIEGIIASTRLQPPPADEEQPKGNIGISLLQRFNLIFDYSNSVLILEKNSFFERPDGFTRSGIQIRPDLTKGLVIAGVIPDSPAADEDLRPGDVITHLNEQSVATLSTDAIDALLLGNGADSLLLTFTRDGASLNKRLRIRDLL